MRLGMFRRSSPAQVKIRPAMVASQNPVHARNAGLTLQDRFLSTIEAISTKLMHIFGGARLIFFNISVNCRHSAGIGQQIGEYIFLFLSFPCFKISHFFFKIAYLVQQRQLVRLGIKCTALGGEDYSLQFDNLSLNHRTVAESHKALSDFARSLERRNGN